MIFKAKLNSEQSQTLVTFRRVWAHKTSLTHATFYWSTCTKQGKWSVMYLCARVSSFASFYDFPNEKVAGHA